MPQDSSCALCGAPGYSKSKEHQRAWLCVVHYQEWLDAKKPEKIAELAKAVAPAAGGKTK